MPLTTYALNTFVAQEFGDLTECKAPPIAESFPQHSHWLDNFVLNAMLRMRLEERTRALAFSLIRRAGAAIEDYEEARLQLAKVVAQEQPVSSYFRALRKLESTSSLLYQAMDFARMATNLHLFKNGDGSPCERLNRIYNTIKHANPEHLPEGHLHTVWITNEGLMCEACLLRFEELHSLLMEAARIAEALASGQQGTGGGSHT